MIFTEKYRPATLDDLIFDGKDKIKEFLNNAQSIPSFLLYSASPGTGKSSLAKIICRTLHCNTLEINGSKDRGVDVVREQINLFSQSESTLEGVKRCVFIDEADGTTPQLQDALRVVVEQCSDNVFFIFSCNDVSKIKPALRSWCVEINFDKPNKKLILERLESICRQERIQYDIEDLVGLVTKCYPDTRAMIMTLQETKVSGAPLKDIYFNFGLILEAVLHKNTKELYKHVYDGDLDILAFNRFFFRYLYDNYEKYGYEKVARASRYLADTEKSYNLGVALNIVMLSNLLSIGDILG